MLVVDEDVVVEDTIRSDNQSQYVYGDVVYFSCIKGFELDGSSSTICKADGRWTSIPPTCHRKYKWDAPVDLNLQPRERGICLIFIKWQL